MVQPLVECVPNISEGRNLAVIEQIVAAVRATAGCSVLGVEPDHDYNRTVITFAGTPKAVEEGAVALILASIEGLDMREHKGEHPRMGVVDVCPFVPLRDVSMETCAEMARRVVERVTKVYPVPMYLYGAAATSTGRSMLSALRKGEYEGLQSRFSSGIEGHDSETRWPDAGSTIWDDLLARSGAITVGARPILVAYNVNVKETDGRVSKMIGSIVRSSGRLLKSSNGASVRSQGMLPNVQGMGVVLEELGISQVSMNLLDVETCPLHLAYKTVESLAQDHGSVLCGSEIVGLVPLKAMLEAGHFFLPNEKDEHELVKAAIENLGLKAYHHFDPNEHIIEWALNKEDLQ
jgi:glutamate formiminotransferase